MRFYLEIEMKIKRIKKLAEKFTDINYTKHTTEGIDQGVIWEFIYFLEQQNKIRKCGTSGGQLDIMLS